MNALITIQVATNSPHDVFVQLLDVTPHHAGQAPVQCRTLRMRPGERHELAVSPGISLCVSDAAPLVREG